MFSIILHEWVSIMRQFFSLGALNIVNLKKYYDDTYNTIYKGVKTANKCNIMQIPQNISYESFIKEFLMYYNNIQETNENK